MKYLGKILIIIVLFFGVKTSAQQVTAYNEAIINGDEYFSEFNFIEAKTYYQLALSFKPDDGYSNNQISEIEKVINSQSYKEDQYFEIIDIADSLFKKYKFDKANAEYITALEILPNDSYAKDKINKIRDIQSSQNEDFVNFNLFMSDGIILLEKNKFTDATKSFKKAARLFPRNKESGKYIANTKFAKKRYEIKLAAYTNEIELANNFIEAKDYVKAITHLNKAVKISPNSWAVLNEIKHYKPLAEKQLANNTTTEENEIQIARLPKNTDTVYSKTTNPSDTQIIEQTKSQKTKYELAIASPPTHNDPTVKTDSIFTEMHYSQSIVHYEKALSIKTDEAYPINNIANNLANIEAEITKKYNEAILLADNYLNENNLTEAVAQFTIASILKPEERYPADKKNEINTIIEETHRKARDEYDLEIANAEKFYAVQIYDKAIIHYRKALKIIPEESYPGERISEIINLMEENTVVDILNNSITIYSDTTKLFTFEPVSIKVRKSNYLFIKASNISGNAFKLLVSYGSDNGKNGGFVVQVPEGVELNDYIVRVGNQYKWFADNNNWISIYPEKGNIEINMISISKSSN